MAGKNWLPKNMGDTKDSRQSTTKDSDDLLVNRKNMVTKKKDRRHDKKDRDELTA
jgi:hypothetical protein